MTQQQSQQPVGPPATAANPSTGSVERNGIHPVPDAERHGTPKSLLWPWAASGLSLLSIAYGVYLMGLGLSPWQTIVTGALGYVLSFLLVGLVSVAGARTGAPTMALGRAAFGTQGNKLPTVFSYLSNVGWETVLVALSSLGGSAILARVAPGTFARADGQTPTTAAQALCFVVTCPLWRCWSSACC
ncbi:cytosine permease [Streptomyces decoyicus]